MPGAPANSFVSTSATGSSTSTDLESTADATENDAAPLGVSSHDWRVFATLYGWVPNFKGDMVVEGQGSDVSLTRSDIWNNLDIAAMGRIEVLPPDSMWSYWTDIFWASLEKDESASVDVSPPSDGPPIPGLPSAGPRIDVDADVRVRMTFVELAAAYHVWHTEETISGLREIAPRTQVDAFGGARYNRMRVNFNLDANVVGSPLSRKVRLDESEDWIDPFIGLRLRHGLAPNWWVALRGDIGGFGIGTSSDRAWTFTGTFQHLIHEDLSIGAGWKIMDLDYDRGDFEADVQMGGPFVTVTYEF